MRWEEPASCNKNTVCWCAAKKEVFGAVEFVCFCAWVRARFKRLRKVRMAIASKGKGKRGGARVITYTVILAQTDAEIKLITIYDKADRENITDAELLDILRRNGIE